MQGLLLVLVFIPEASSPSSFRPLSLLHECRDCKSSLKYLALVFRLAHNVRGVIMTLSYICANILCSSVFPPPTTLSHVPSSLQSGWIKKAWIFFFLLVKHRIITFYSSIFPSKFCIPRPVYSSLPTSGYYVWFSKNIPLICCPVHSSQP